MYNPNDCEVCGKNANGEGSECETCLRVYCPDCGSERPRLDLCWECDDDEQSS